ETLQRHLLEQRAIAVQRASPLLVVVATILGILARPGAARTSVWARQKRGHAFTLLRPDDTRWRGGDSALLLPLLVQGLLGDRRLAGRLERRIVGAGLILTLLLHTARDGRAHVLGLVAEGADQVERVRTQPRAQPLDVAGDRSRELRPQASVAVLP